MLTKNLDFVEPCVRCDSDSLKVLNKYAASTRSVGVRFRMSKFCERCECHTFKDKLAYWQCKICDDQQEVCVGVPIGIYGSVQRAIESSKIASKGSDFRAHGSFVSMISLLKAPELEKIAMGRWIPSVMIKAMSGKAHINLPLDFDDTYMGDYTDYKRINFSMELDKYGSRVTPVLKRMRKLREDEVLTEKGTLLLRRCSNEARKILAAYMRDSSSDDIFTLELVTLRKKGDTLAVESIPEHDVEETRAEEICQAYHGHIADIEGKIQGKIDAMNWELDRMKMQMQERLLDLDLRREAEVSPDVKSPNQLDPSFTAVDEGPRYERSLMLAARPILSGQNSGFAAMSRRERRQWRVVNRE